jgi:hypothetical protein
LFTFREAGTQVLQEQYRKYDMIQVVGGKESLLL